MIKKLFNSFIPLLFSFLMISGFLIWSQFSIEEKSRRRIVIKIPKSNQTVDEGTNEAIRVLYPMFLLRPTYSPLSEIESSHVRSGLKALHEDSQSFNTEELNDLFASLLIQNEYQEAQNVRSILLTNLSGEQSSELLVSTVHYNVGILELILDNYSAASKQFDKVVSFQNPYLLDLAKSLVLIRFGREVEGSAMIKKVIKKAPEKVRPLIHFKVGNLYSRLKKFELALDELGKVLTLDSSFYQARLNTAVVYRKMNRYQDAERIYAKLLTDYPGYFKGIYNYGILLQKVNRKSEAIKAFEKALSLNLRHKELRLKLAEMLFTNQKYIKALVHYRWLMKESPGNWEYILMVAKTELKLNNSQEAIRLMNYAIEKKGGNYPKAWIELGDAYLLIKDDDSAIEAYQNALKLERTNKNVLGRLAKYYSRKNNFTKEFDYYRQALNADRNDGLYLRRMGISLIKQKKAEEGIKYLEDSIDHVNNPYRSYKYLARAYEDLKNFKKAASYYQLALDLQPQDELDWYRYGIVLYKLGKYKKSVAAFLEAESYSDQENHKFVALIKKRRANAYTKNKKFTKAIRTFEEVLELNSASFTARLDYSKLLLRLKGRKEAGKKELKLALKLEPENCKALKIANKYKLDSYQQRWETLWIKK